MAHSKTEAGRERERARGRAYYQKNRERRIALIKACVAKKPEYYRLVHRDCERRRRAEARMVAFFAGLLADLPTAVLSSLCGEGHGV